MELQLNTWTGNTGVVREYITNVHELIGFKPRRNKQGRVVGGSYKGHADIAGKWARELNEVQAYIQDGKLVIGGDAEMQAEVREVLAPLVDAYLAETTQPADEQPADEAPVAHTGIELKCRREALGLSQSLAAKAFGVSQVAWSHWENGKRTIPAGILSGMAGIEEAMRAEVIAHLRSLESGRRAVMRPQATYLPQARAIPDDVDQAVIADAIGRVAAGRAYAMAWLERGYRMDEVQIDEIRR